ncbi:MAG: hypothetical protein BWX88_04776 [Planctomycetes bacterium ADurb.Bin126]|nr:MAG: hypothetical protein BWX88_04776 [Planctomycetes bacterium ADurb.Bin126]
MLLVALIAGAATGTYSWFYGDRVILTHYDNGRREKWISLDSDTFLVLCVIRGLAVLVAVIVVWILATMLWRLATRWQGVRKRSS